MSDALAHFDEASFKAAVSGATPVLVDFWAPWCGPCKAIAPILDELAKDFGPRLVIGKVNVDDHGGIAETYGVRAIPTMLLFKSGQLIDTLVGMQSKDSLKAKLTAKI